MTTETLLEARRIRSLRLRAGLSRRAIAPQLALSQTAVRSIEQGRNHDDLTLRHVRKLAQALGVESHELLAPPPSRRTGTEDSAVIIAALQHAARPLRREQLCEALKWPLSRVVAALDSAQRQLRGTGLNLIQTGHGQCRLDAAPDALDDTAVHRLSAPPDPPTPLKGDALRLLKRLIERPPEHFERSLSDRDRAALPQLLANQILTLDGDGDYKVSDKIDLFAACKRERTKTGASMASRPDARENVQTD